MTSEIKDKIFFGLFVAMGLVIAYAGWHNLHNRPLVKYKLSTGEIVECRFEIGQEIVRLNDCKNGLEYIAQTNVTRLGESK